MPETGSVNKRAKCRMIPASDIAPEGVTHDTHYTLAEVMRKFGIKYGRLYEIRNRYQLASVHAWGTTAFRKEDVEDAIAKYDEEQGKRNTILYSSSCSFVRFSRRPSSVFGAFFKMIAIVVMILVVNTIVDCSLSYLCVSVQRRKV